MTYALAITVWNLSYAVCHARLTSVPYHIAACAEKVHACLVNVKAAYGKEAEQGIDKCLKEAP